METGNFFVTGHLGIQHSRAKLGIQSSHSWVSHEFVLQSLG